MNLKSIFANDIDRTIEGVIKADDESSLRTEVEEYVLTQEVEKSLETFLDVYNNYDGANGVWISGFFGSGKSHLLKMLAFILENREIDGAKAFDLFIPKCGDNEILRGDLARAVKTPSKSILFNIDQKADIISKTQIDALLAVFVKVFDEMCGYYGKQPYIAQFERELDLEGKLSDFKQKFEELAKKEWDWGRGRTTRFASFADQAYNAVTGQNQKNVLDKYRDDYRLSIEDFAENVKDYIERQGSDFRLNFFVDEIGQYIADNEKLMTNLQTVAESLATKCRGRAWIVVTSQNDMTTVLGQINKQQSNDFSKIMDRFGTRILLTGTNVAEVIQKRLLRKTSEAAEIESDLYHRESNNFGTLFGFTDGSRNYKIYRDRDDFVRCYPFVPYHFELFQSAIENLSRQNAFEGKHTSVGERSMLAVFQQATLEICDQEIGRLATFDLMFDGIQNTLKAQTQRSILAAERQVEDKFAIRLLKALFLVKYVKEFKSSSRNLCVLMLDSFDQDIRSLRTQVEEALNILENGTYIQRNGDIYEFLTDKEQDVENAIKQTEIQSDEVEAEIEKLVFDYVLDQRKIRDDETGQDHTFAKKIDDHLRGREHELFIHIVTPFNENSDDEKVVQMQSMGRDELLILMPADAQFARHLMMYKRTGKYIRQNISTTQEEDLKTILTTKGYQNDERYSDIKRRVKNLLSKSKVFVGGTETEIGSEDARTRIIKGFHELVAQTYPHLKMLRGINYTEDKIASILKDRQGTLQGSETSSLSEAEQEVLAFIQSNSRGGMRTTVKSLLEKFEKKPYGWYLAAVLCVLAKLCVRGKVEVRMDGNLLDESELERALRNTHAHANVILEPQVEFTAGQIRALKEFHEDFFDKPPAANEAKALAQETRTAIENMEKELQTLSSQLSDYPFSNALRPVIDKLLAISGKPYGWYPQELVKQEDELLDMKEETIDPIRKFWSGSQRKILDKARQFYAEQEPNFESMDSAWGDKSVARERGSAIEQVNKLRKVVTDPNCFKGDSMQNLKSLVEDLEELVSKEIAAEKEKARNSIGEYKERFKNMDELSKLDQEKKNALLKRFDEVAERIEAQKYMPMIRDTLSRFVNSDFPALLQEMISSDEGGESKQKDKLTTMSTVVKEVPYEKAWLASEADVDEYIASVRNQLLYEIKQGKRIQI